jgi:hypothetical protein
MQLHDLLHLDQGRVEKRGEGGIGEGARYKSILSWSCELHGRVSQIYNTLDSYRDYITCNCYYLLVITIVDSIERFSLWVTY